MSSALTLSRALASLVVVAALASFPALANGAVAVVASSPTVVNSTPTSSIVLARPSAASSGNVLVAQFALNGSVTAVAAPAGWTQIVAVTSLANPKLYAFRHVVGVADPVSYTFSWSTSVANGGAITAYSGVDPASPIDGAPSVATGASAATGTVAGVSATSAGSHLVGGMALNSGSATSTPPAGMGERWEALGKSNALSSAALSAAGATGSRTWTFSGSREWAGYLVALRAVATSTVDTTAPVVSITSPKSGDTVSGTITVAVTASDNVGLRQTELWVDGVWKGDDTTSPYSFQLNTDSLASGLHSLQARAIDTAGNIGSSSIGVNVGAPIAAAPTVTSFSPTSGNVGTSVALTGTNLTGVTAVRFNGTAAGFSVTSATSIQTTVPAGATTGPVSVTSTSGTATSSGSFSVTATTTSGTMYYVDGVSGNDANNGTSSSTPWRTMAKATSATLRPGDTLLLKRDTSYTSRLTIDESGTASAPIRIDAYGSGSAVPLLSGSAGCLRLNGSYLSVSSVAVDRCDWSGVDVYGDQVRLDRIVTTNNVTGVFIRPTASGTKLLNSIIRDNNRMSVLTSGGDDDSGAFGVLLQGDFSEIGWNTISGSDAFSYDYGRDGAAVELYGGQNNLIHHNVTFANDAFTELGNSRTANNTFAYNSFSSSNPRSIFLVTRGAGSTWGPVAGTKVHNNSVYLTGSSSQGFVCHAGCSATILQMRNNVIQAAKAGYADASFDEDYDLFSGTLSGSWARGSHTLLGTPGFVNAPAGDLHLVVTSPGVDRGVTGLGYTQDLDGGAVPADGNGDGTVAPDMGAFERR